MDAIWKIARIENEFPVHTGLKLDNQAQFNPLPYVQGLARAAGEMGAGIHAHSPVREIDYDQGVLTTDAAEVRAPHIVLATHTPKGIDLLQTAMVPSREYGVSAKLSSGTYPDGIFWMLDPLHSLRSYHGAVVEGPAYSPLTPRIAPR